jgi:hypothetical protein
MAKLKSSAAQAEVLEGIGEWLKFPQDVIAPAPHNRMETCRFRVSTEDAYEAARYGRRQPAFELWSVILGKQPPVPGVVRRNRPATGELLSLMDAHALFRGIERPIADDDDGGNVLAYILKPQVFYEYDPNMVSVAVKTKVPDGLLFIAHARLDSVPGSAVGGAVTHWGFVEADPTNAMLPVDFACRYRTQLWWGTRSWPPQ